MSRHCGFSLLELIIAMTLGALVLTAATATLYSQTRLARATGASVQRNEVLRIATQVLTLETRWLVRDRDVRAWAPDSLALRAFRASGSVCHSNEDGSALVLLDALRAPDPAKDSLLILRDSSTELAAQLISANATTVLCRARPALNLRAAHSLQAGDVILLFESGAYHLADRALRYRLGREGRQPLTEEAFDPPRTFFTLQGARALAVLRTTGSAPVQSQLHLPFLGNRQ